MSTHSRIGILNADKTITSIYCHNNGYQEHNGRILKEFYSDTDKVKTLMLLGDISVLGEKIHPTETHTFDKPQSGVCIAYARDRGESDTQAQTSVNLKAWEFLFEAYNYLWDSKEWKVYQ
jgi:hypothetical protein